MLLTKADAPRDDAEWRRFLEANDFGQIIAAGIDRQVPVVVPTHFTLEGTRTVEVHLHRRNPLWEALLERPYAVLAVIGSPVYVPTYWNGEEDEPPELAIPTSYYAAVQAMGPVRLVEDPPELAAMLNRQLSHFQPEGRHGTVAVGNELGDLVRAVRGMRLEIEAVRGKFKFGGNRPEAHRRRIAGHLAQRGDPADQAARRHLLDRLADGGEPP